VTVKGKLRLGVVGLAIGWLFVVVFSVRLFDGGLTAWEEQQKSLSQSQQRLKRLRGWLEVEEQVIFRREEVLGPFAKASLGDLSWMAVQGFQEAAKACGVSVTELRPSTLPGQGRIPSSFRLDARVEGRLNEIAALLARLPSALPGIGLNNLQLAPYTKGQVQGLLRLELLSLEGKGKQV